MSTPLSGGYCGGVPPLPIPNREVKPTCADGTAMQCGRVGSRLLFIRAFIWAIKWTLFLFIFLAGLLFPRLAKVVSQMVWCLRASRKSLFKGFVACGPPANYFLKDFALAGLPQITFKRILRLRTSRKSLFKRFGISALGESHFPNGLEFPRMAKVVSRMVWHFRAWRESFSEWFGVSAHDESCFPNGLKFSPYAETFVRSWSVCCSLSLITYNIFCFIMASIYLVEDFLLHG